MEIAFGIGLILFAAVSVYVSYRFLSKTELSGQGFDHYPSPLNYNIYNQDHKVEEKKEDLNYEILHSELDAIFEEAAKEAEKIPAKKRASAPRKSTKKAPTKKSTKKATTKKSTKKATTKKA